MKIIRTEQVFIRDNGAISIMCHISKNLFNQTNYILRNQFFSNEKMSPYKELAKQFAEPSELEENNNFQKLPAKTAQWTIKKVKQSWTSFFGALRSYKKNPELFNGVPKPPKYKHRNGEFMLIGGKLKHPGWEESKCINCGVIYSRDKLASLSISVRVLYL